MEDDATLRATMVALFEHWNYTVVEAGHGEEALALLADKHDQIDLIVSDVVMPTMGGISLLRTLRQRGIETPKIILLTGRPMGEELEEMRKFGLNAWLPKPHAAG